MLVVVIGYLRRCGPCTAKRLLYRGAGAAMLGVLKQTQPNSPCRPSVTLRRSSSCLVASTPHRTSGSASLQAELHVETTKKAFDDLSSELRAELGEFDAQKVRELQQTMIDYVESMRTLQHQILKAWEAFLPEVKGIAQ